MTRASQCPISLRAEHPLYGFPIQKLRYNIGHLLRNFAVNFCRYFENTEIRYYARLLITFFFSCNCKMRLGVVCNYNEDVNKQSRKALLTLVSASPLFVIVILCQEEIYTLRNCCTEMPNVSSLYRQPQNAVFLPIVPWLIA
jgi:hypothetical protein